MLIQQIPGKSGAQQKRKNKQQQKINVKKRHFKNAQKLCQPGRRDVDKKNQGWIYINNIFVQNTTADHFFRPIKIPGNVMVQGDQQKI
ncbi:MAG: hypothetical protein ACLFPD_04445 [Desulfosudaceae bacterium]